MPECDIYLLNLQHDTSAAAGRADGLPERHGELLTFKTDTMQQIRDFGQLTEQLRAAGRRKRVAVVCPGDTHTEYVIRRALEEHTADFLLVDGGADRWDIDSLARSYPGRVELVRAADPDAAARQAVAMVRECRADVLMKGCLNTDNLLRAVLDKQCGLLQPGRVMSHITAVQAPGYGKLLLATDVAVIPRPDLEQFDAMLGYAVATARSLGTEAPRVALIHCTEKVSDRFPHTLSYEELKRRAIAGRYGAASVDGPMDVRTACDAESAAVKGISSGVAGCADVLVFPNIEAGNTFYKTVSFFGRASMAGMLCGTTVPVVLASRADTGESKYNSLAMACLAGPGCGTITAQS